MISIIIPVYNTEKYLEKCIQSVINQTYQAWEMILVNDGSSDSSGKICDMYSEADARIKVVHGENAGLSVARNRGIDIAKGDYITFLDSDDYWMNATILERLVDRISKTHPDVLSFNFCKEVNGQLKKPYFEKEVSFDLNLDERERLSRISKHGIWIACAWNKIIRRTLFEKYDLHFVPGLTAEDVGWCAKLASVTDKLDYIDVQGVAYVQRGDSITGTLNEKKITALKLNIDTVIECVKHTNKEKQDFLCTYLAYQIGVFLYDVASFKELTRVWKKDIEKYLVFLDKSDNLKIKLFYWINKIFGLKILFLVINVYRGIIK